MSLLDLIVLLIIGASVVAGFMAGFARVALGFVAAIFGILFGFWFYGIPAAWVHKYIHSEAASNLIGFFLVLSLFVSVGTLVGQLLAKLFKWTGFSWLDRLMGGAFGFVRGGLVVVAFIAVLLAFTPKPMPNWMVNSRVLPYAINTSKMLAALAPNGIKNSFRESVEEIRETWHQQLTNAREELEPKKPASKKGETNKKNKSRAEQPSHF